MGEWWENDGHEWKNDGETTHIHVWMKNGEWRYTFIVI